jgi:hypothetical protein
MDRGDPTRVGFAPMNQIKLTAELLAEGWSSAELERMARSGELHRIRRGAYEFAPARSLERRDQHRRLIAATLRMTSVDSVISHMICRRFASFADLERPAGKGPRHG